MAPKFTYQIYEAIREGRMYKPNTCEECGAEVRLHAHHEDYSKPLDVIWLCTNCHKKRHPVKTRHNSEYCKERIKSTLRLRETHDKRLKNISKRVLPAGNTCGKM